jgi:hypothetical protein
MHVRRLLAAFCLCASLPAMPVQAAERATLDAVSVHLFLQKSGALSTDVTAIEGFFARNFVPDGKDFAEGERFDDVLVRIRFTARKEIFAEGPQAEVVVTDSASKKVVSRKRIADLYVGGHGWTFVPVYLAGVACKPLTVTVTGVTVTGGGKRIVKTLPFSCGE